VIEALLGWEIGEFISLKNLRDKLMAIAREREISLHTFGPKAVASLLRNDVQQARFESASRLPSFGAFF
jgi:hypothetical protein